MFSAPQGRKYHGSNEAAISGKKQKIKTDDDRWRS
jgi:hypothetical protein